MSFLDKQKGKTYNMNKQEGKTQIGKTNSHQNVTSLGQASATFSPIVKNKSAHFPSEKDKNSKANNNSPQDKKSRVSPFHVVHNFYLDELQKEKAERQKIQKQQRQRVEKQKKKRMEIMAKLRQAGKQHEDKFKNKDWIPLGGLGPNIGTEDWNHRTELHKKMLNFSKQIKKVNVQKIKCVPFMSVSQLQNGPKTDARSLAIQYSRGVPRPKIMAGEQIIGSVPRSESKDELSELQRLDMNHMKYMELMKGM